MRNPLQDIKVKLFLGYFILVIITGLTGWLVYSELIQNGKESVKINPANEKIIYINGILSNLYTAEGLERNLLQTGDSKYFSSYIELMDSVELQIDSLNTLIENPGQKNYTDTILTLLENKRKNITELKYLKENYSASALYEKTLKDLELNRDSIIQYFTVSQKQTTKYDSTYIKREKPTFFNRLFGLFSDQTPKDSALQVKISKYIQRDSLYNNMNPADSVAALLNSISKEIKNRSLNAEKRIRLKEKEILESDKTITLQLKEILSVVENEELMASFTKVYKQQEHNEVITRYIVLLGILALFTILFFAVNILRDVTKSQHYRQGLESAKNETELVLKSKEQFMLSLTHDLKSPLNAISGFTSLIAAEKTTPTVKRYLKNIEQSSTHILKLVNSLLDLARLQQGKLNINPVPVNLCLLINEVTENYRPGAINKKVDFKLDNKILPEQNYIGDPVRITQILVNLISNAIKFTNTGSVEVRVAPKSINDKTDEITLEVIDTGIGIDRDELPYIFDEFARGKADKGSYEGTGLGLTITKKLVDLLQGNISVISSPGKGSHFTLKFPLDKTGQKAENIPDIKSEKTTSDLAVLREMTIWVVDDDELMLEMLDAVLTSYGATVRVFNDPLLAANEFETRKADLVITDVQMPGMDGPDLLKRIKQKSGGSFPAIAMSGRDESSDQEIEDNFMAFIQKPFDPNDLLDIIVSSLEKIINGKVVNTEQDLSYSLDKIKRFVGEDREGLKSILRSYVETSKEHITLLETNLTDRNFDNISEVAHKMLNFLRQMEVRELIGIFSDLENYRTSGMTEQQLIELTFNGIRKMNRLIHTIKQKENI
ncbi:hybrid sensor histidine kinase/response regulator [Saccharicrinis sp. FJH54]|uniref:hybrid sensor histidine kinase/response regulator n=1 Tax=Saccharicrinis sp. FJH54 TaxID=3344665 RepID=UPI0035D47973